MGRRRVRAIALLAVLSLLLAGCSGDAGDSDDSPTTGSSTTTTTGPPPKPVVYSDTLHFLEAPNMAPALPVGSSEVRTPTNSFGSFGGGGGGGGQGDDEPNSLWEYKLTNGANLTGGEIHVWIEITETLVPSPFTFPGQDACTWFVILALGADNEVDVPCLTEPPGPISPITKELVFPFLNTDTFSLQANETISVRFGRTAFGASMEPSVFVLSGSADHDSRIQIKGLQEVVDE